MPDKKSYTAVLSTLETHISYIKEDIGEIKEHLSKINGHLDDHADRLITVEVKQEERNKPSKKSIAGWVSGAIAIAIALWKAFTNGG